MRHYIRNKRKNRLYRILIPAALLYSVFLCITGVYSAISHQMEAYLFQHIQAAQQFALEGEAEINPVYLRRDQNNQITAVTVNGILLNQLQNQYYHFLCQTTPKVYPIRLKATHLLGSDLFFWVPGRISLSIRPEVHWNAEVISRTFSQETSNQCFQLLLVTTGEASIFPWHGISVNEELVLYEALLYN